MEKIKTFFTWLRSCISPVYVMMLIAAFVLWFTTKLGEKYTTYHEVTVVIDGKEYNVDCKMHGRGTDLIYYTLSSKRSRFTIPSSELSLVEVVDGLGNVTVQVTLESLTGALAHVMDDLDEVKVDMPLVIKEITAESEKLNKE